MRARSLTLALTWTLTFAGCAATTGAVQPRGPRTSADDTDMWNVVPGDTDALADVDLAALRASPWSRSLMQGDLDGERETRRRRFGYDVFTEAERMLLSGNESTGQQSTLTIARGRFEIDRIATAFQGATPGAATTEWRGSPLIEGQGRAVALVTSRTIAHGDGPRVRAAVDAAWGVVPDVGGGPLGELRRALDADKNPPAVTLALSVTDGMRARAAGVLVVPDGLRRLGARLDLGEDLNVEGLALFDSGGNAATAASIWNETARGYARQRMIVLLGLGPVFDGLSVAAEGSRVHVRLHIPADKREGLADKLLAFLQLVAKTRH
ncbi:MAG TPA: hypothetical protein VKQ32_24260 [Polyangia bacterium]|nr:hypothetical protein [Polyangia bacterium]